MIQIAIKKGDEGKGFGNPGASGEITNRKSENREQIMMLMHID